MNSTTEEVTPSRRPRNWIPLVSFAMVDKIPQAIALRDCLIPFAGCSNRPDALWGGYGTVSHNELLFMADGFARRQRKQMMRVVFWYELTNLARVTSKITAEIVAESGFVHLARLQADYKESLKSLVLRGIRKNHSRSTVEALELMDLEQIVLQCPESVETIFANDRKVLVVVHPARQLYDETYHRPIWVGTVRNVKSRIKVAEVAYLEHIRVEY